MDRRHVRLAPKVLRLAAFAAVVSLAVGGFAARARAAATRDGLLALGARMMRYGSDAPPGATRRLAINGGELSFASDVTRDGLDGVLDAYERRCRERAGGGARSTLRHAANGRGYVACFDAGGARRSAPREVLRRLRAAVASGDLGDVGGLRYAYAERSADGRTHFVTLWTDGRLDVRRMFPATGDAPGEDPPGIARAPGLRRVLTAREAEVPGNSVWIFAGSVAPAQLERHYRAAMQRDGWTAAAAPPPASPSAPTLLPFRRGDAVASVVLDARVPGRTDVTVFLSR